LPGPVPPPIADDAIRWNGATAEVLVVTDKVRREIEARPDFKNNTTIALRANGGDQHLTVLAAKLPWVTSLVIGITTPTVTDLTPIAGLRQLRSLHLSANAVKTLAPLAGLPSLESLTFTCDGRAFADHDLVALESITTLRTLSLRNCSQITSLHGVERMTNLAAVSLSASGVRDLRPLAPATKMTSLTIMAGSGAITDITPLASMTSLSFLSIGGLKAADFTPLRSMSKLRFLDLSRTGIRDLSVLTGMNDLESLSVGANDQVAFATLPSLPNLHMLFAAHTNLRNTQPIASSCPTLQHLHIDQTAVVDLHPLHLLTKLSTMTVAETVSDQEVRAARKALPQAAITRVGKALPEDPRRVAIP